MPTLTRYLLASGRASGPDAGLAQVLSAIAVAAKGVAALVARGEPMAEARTALLEQLSDVPEVAGVLFAGDEAPTALSPQGRHLVLADLVHSMANLTDNLTVGATFSVLPTAEGDASAEAFLQPGSQLVAAGLAVFGPRTLLLLTTGEGVDGFTLDRDIGTFVLTHAQMTIPTDTAVFASDMSRASHWPAPIRRYVDECVQGTDGPRGQRFTLRWNASSAVGVFRVLNSGGTYLVPRTSDANSWVAPLLATAVPLAFLVEQAGGRASTGTGRVLDEVPAELTTGVPLLLGNAAEVQRLDRYVLEHERGEDRDTVHPLFQHRTLFID